MQYSCPDYGIHSGPDFGSNSKSGSKSNSKSNSSSNRSDKSAQQPIKSTGLRIDSKPGHHNLLALHSLNPDRYPFLLESVAHAANEGCHSRFDILFAFPQETLTLSNHEVLSGYDDISGNDFLTNLDHWWQTRRSVLIQNPIFPFSGGWFLYLGYELAKQIEPRLKLKPTSTPLAYATRIPAAIIYDHETDITYFVCEEEFDYFQRLKNDLELTHELPVNNVSLEIDNVSLENVVHEEEKSGYLEAVTRVKQYIVDGDVFQVNLSRLWHVDDVNLSAVALYQKLRLSNPSPFAGLAVHQGFSIISSSPERLIRVKNGIAETRPVAGTRGRDQDEKTDEALKSELITHPKERAEHIMLIDLERNDLGRVCIPGTIKVNEFMVLESYAHVHHIVSNVRGALRGTILPGEVIKAVFPGGTITGCPKERCMAIISELEHEARGAYTGSMGYLNHNGDMDINILIRTMTLEKNKLYFRAGAGLVADSQAQAELEETQQKAKGLLLSLE